METLAGFFLPKNNPVPLSKGMAKKSDKANETKAAVETPPENVIPPATDMTKPADPAPADPPPLDKPADPAPVVDKETPSVVEPAKVVDDAPLVGEKPANVLEFPGSETPATDAQMFPPSQPLNPGANEPTKETVGCQCKKCKATGGNKDKRGRHHATCPCNTCATARGETPVADKPADPNPFAAVADTATDDNKKFAVLGEMSFDMGAGCLCMLFGQEWGPKSPEERQQVSTAIANYYKSKGVQDLPPGALLAVVLLAYGMPRLAHKNTQSKLQLAWAWAKVKVGGIFRRKAKLTVLNTN